MPEDIIARFSADFPEEHLAALATTIVLACRKSAEAVRARYREDSQKATSSAKSATTTSRTRCST